MLIAPKRLKLRTSNLTYVFPGTARTWHPQIFPKRGVFKNSLGGDMHSHECLLVINTFGRFWLLVRIIKVGFWLKHVVPPFYLANCHKCEIRDGQYWQTTLLAQKWLSISGCWPWPRRLLWHCQPTASARQQRLVCAFCAALLLLLILAVVGGLNRSVIAGRIAVGWCCW